ncbi:MAG TPA: DNA replication/repair protein RecF [Candidatus Saccharimonadales bacterium]|nr:DNA replication/repair protein RecF [Candidatus Saccharimonadales bacterium]
MKINSLSLTNYRSHKKRHVEFAANSTLIFGNNGAGKTNILEAIHMLSTTKSFRAEYERDVINHDADFARIDATVEVENEKNKLEMLIIKSKTFENASSKKVAINKTTKSLQKFAGLFNSVLFSPEDIDLVTGSPAHRRKYIDLIMFQIDYEYKKATAAYTKALRQRNKLLEMIFKENRGQDQIGFWTQKILESGKVIQTKRDELFKTLTPKLIENGEKLNPNHTHFTIKYQKNEISEARLESHSEKEIYARTTLVGPHRDDFEIFINERGLAGFGSRGQQRSAVLALKLSEMDYLSERIGERPVLLLDDIFSELDERHRAAVTSIMDLQQTIVTSAEDLKDLKFENVINLLR